MFISRSCDGRDGTQFKQSSARHAGCAKDARIEQYPFRIYGLPMVIDTGRAGTGSARATGHKAAAINQKSKKQEIRTA
jgi:hypothetical protein